MVCFYTSFIVFSRVNINCRNGDETLNFNVRIPSLCPNLATLPPPSLYLSVFLHVATQCRNVEDKICEWSSLVDSRRYSHAVRLSYEFIYNEITIVFFFSFQKCSPVVVTIFTVPLLSIVNAIVYVTLHSQFTCMKPDAMHKHIKHYGWARPHPTANSVRVIIIYGEHAMDISCDLYIS